MFDLILSIIFIIFLSTMALAGIFFLYQTIRDDYYNHKYRKQNPDKKYFY